MGPWSRIEILASYLSLYKNDWFLFSGFKKTKGCFELRQIQLCFQFGMDCRHNHPKARFAHSGNYKGIVPPCDPGWGAVPIMCVFDPQRGGLPHSSLFGKRNQLNLLLKGRVDNNI